MYVQVDTMGGDAGGTLAGLPGVTRVTVSDTRDSVVGFEVESETGRDVRRDLAAAVVGRGWGLLELRPMRMSLEDVFLKLTTQESDAPVASDVVAAEQAEVAHD